MILGIRSLDDVHFLEVVHVHQSLAARVDTVVVVAVAREEAELSSYDNVFRSLVAGDVNDANVEEGRFVHFVENIDSDAVVRLLFGKEDLGSADSVGVAQGAEVIPQILGVPFHGLRRIGFVSVHLDHRDDVGEVHVPELALAHGDVVDIIGTPLVDRDVEGETVAFLGGVEVVIDLGFGVSDLLVHLGDLPHVVPDLVFLVGAEHEPEAGFRADQEFDLGRGDKRVAADVDFPDVGFLALRHENVDAGFGAVHGVVYLVGDVRHAVALFGVIFADLLNGNLKFLKA